jgi:nucleoside-diphosphate-sugar epimerase
MKVLVTGATGFFGSHIVRILAARGHRPIALHRAGSNLDRLKRLAAGADSFRRAVADIRIDGDIARVLDDIRPDAVVHAAAYGVDYREQDLEEAVATNVTATGRLVAAARRSGVRRFLHVGTCFEYGNHDGPLGEASALRPNSLYGSTKAGGSLLALALAGAGPGDLDLCVVRPFGMYGPLEGGHKFVPQVLTAARRGMPMECSPGGQERDYSYVGDIAEACGRLLTLDRFPAGQAVNLASGRTITMRRLAETAAAVAGSSGGFLNWGAHPYRPGETMRIEADTAKARSLLGDLPGTSLADGLRETLAWEDMHFA